MKWVFRWSGYRLTLLLIAVLSLVACGQAPQAGTSHPEAAPSAISTAAPAPSSTPAAVRPLHVLFIGNSLTFFNNMPATFAALAASGGVNVEVEQLAFPGFSLEQHSKEDRTAATLERQDWDYVVLQEQSSVPSIPEQRSEQMVPAIRRLVAMSEAQGVEPILFMTWGARDGNPEAGYDDYHSMQAALRAGYMGIADELKVGVAPVGVAWQLGLEKNPRLELWQNDGIHPSAAGSYLAASVFYAALLGQSPEGLAYAAGGALDPRTAGFLQAVAAETVLANPVEWNLAP